MLRNRQKTSLKEKPMIERTNEWLPESLARMTREDEQREQRLTGDVELLRSQQEQTMDTRLLQ